MKYITITLSIVLLIMATCQRKRPLQKQRIVREVPEENMEPAHEAKKAADKEAHQRQQEDSHGMKLNPVGQESDPESPIQNFQESDYNQPQYTDSPPAKSNLNRSKGEKIYHMAEAKYKNSRQEKALDMYLSSCQFGYMPGCHRYGWHLMQQNNITGAKQFYLLACKNGILKSCNNLGWHAEKNGDYYKAQDYYSWACLGKHPGSCRNLKRVVSILKETHKVFYAH